MANLVMKRTAEVASHGFSMFLDPKRLKLQDVEILEMMEDEKPLADPDAPTANVHPTMSMPSPLLPAQGQEAAVHGSIVGTASGSKCSEPPLTANQVVPMDVEEADVPQCQEPQPGQPAPFWSGFF